MKKILAFGMLLLLGAGCRKTKPATDNPVPSVPVQMNVYPNDPVNFKIRSIGGWVYYPGGIAGLIIYRKSNEEFVVIERTSSQLPFDDNAVVMVSSDNFTLRDTISDSAWGIVDGGVLSGPAKWPLRLYGNTYDGNTLRIVN